MTAREAFPPAALLRSRQATRNRLSMQSAAGTVASRVTGLLRLIVVAYALGGKQLADAFNLANSTPNIIHDLVLGGVLGATFVPVFIERLLRSSREEAMRSISAVVSLAVVLLVVTTVLFELAAPNIIDLYTFGAHTPEERALAIELLRYFAPQLACYGALSIIGAVLAIDNRFAAVGVVPVVNNVVAIVVLVIFRQLDRSGSLLAHEPAKVAFLGLGTTAAVALQALALVPSLRRSSLRLRFVWRPTDAAVRRVVQLSGWTFGFVVTNQIAVFIVLALNYHLGPGAVSDYTYAYTFFQFPFGVAAAAIVSVATPEFARLYASHDRAALGQRFGVAVRQLLAVILPCMAAYLVLAQPAVTLLLQRGLFSHADAQRTAAVLVLFALGLPGYCVYFLCVRAFQAMQQTRTAFYCYLLENGLNVGLAIALYHPLGIQGLALSYAAAYSASALVALVVLRDQLGSVGGTRLVRSAARSLGLALAMAVVLAFVDTVLGPSSGIIGWGKLIVTALLGILTYLGGAGAAGTLAGWTEGRRSGTRNRGEPSGAHRSGHGQRQRPAPRAGR